MLEPTSSWVAKWQRLTTFEPGLYAIEVVGELPGDALEQCEISGKEHRQNAKAGKA